MICCRAREHARLCQHSFVHVCESECGVYVCEQPGKTPWQFCFLKISVHICIDFLVPSRWHIFLGEKRGWNEYWVAFEQTPGYTLVLEAQTGKKEADIIHQSVHRASAALLEWCNNINRTISYPLLGFVLTFTTYKVWLSRSLSFSLSLFLNGLWIKGVLETIERCEKLLRFSKLQSWDDRCYFHYKKLTTSDINQKSIPVAVR